MTHLDRLVSRAGVDLARDVDVAWIATDGRRRGESVALLMGRLDPGVLLLSKPFRAGDLAQMVCRAIAGNQPSDA